jgi:uncharacterized protein YdhG (YjbR/CyaY superfamily)
VAGQHVGEPIAKVMKKPVPKKKKPAANVDDYLSSAPSNARDKLAQLRKIVKASIPNAEEGMGYGMPLYKSCGARIAFAPFTKHLSLFGVASVVKERRRELREYGQTEKGTIHFPLDKPLPVKLIVSLLKARMEKVEKGK